MNYFQIFVSKFVTSHYKPNNSGVEVLLIKNQMMSGPENLTRVFLEPCLRVEWASIPYFYPDCAYYRGLITISYVFF